MNADYSMRLPDLRWFVVMVKSRHEKSAAEMLLAQGLSHFLPLHRQMRQWSDRRQMVEMPLFNGYLFVRMNTSFEGRLAILRTPGVLGFVSNHNGPVPVPDSEVENLQSLLTHSADYVQLPYLAEGEHVRVIRGSLAGIEGRLLRSNSTVRLILSIELIRKSLAVHVSRQDVELVSRNVA